MVLNGIMRRLSPFNPVLLRAGESDAAITVGRDGRWALHRSEKTVLRPSGLHQEEGLEVSSGLAVE